MSEYPVKEIMNDTISKKSEKVYSKRWEDFKSFLQSDGEPTEDDYLRYMKWLKNDKKLKASTLWAIYSMLNSAHQNNYGVKLQEFRRLITLLKSYNSDYERVCAKAFTTEQIMEFLNLPLGTPFWLARKCAVALMVCCGLRKADLINLDVADVQEAGETYYINIKDVKRVDKDNHIPYINPNFAPYIRNYLQRLREDLGENISGRLFKGTPEFANKPPVFVKQVMGVHKMEKFGIDIAKKLGLSEPERYTHHSFRRTSANLAAEAGCSSTEMMNRFGWSSAKTAQRYIDKMVCMSSRA